MNILRSYPETYNEKLYEILRHHNRIMLISMYIVVLVVILLIGVISLSTKSTGYKQLRTLEVLSRTDIEIILTLIPTILLLMITGPNSINELEINKNNKNIGISIMITGYQWYWMSEVLLSDKTTILEKLIITTEENKNMKYLSNGNSIFLSSKIVMKLIITSNDVIHSLSIPSLGLKLDAIPGRLNVESIKILREGNIIGYCTELCGDKHNSMLLNISVLPLNLYLYNLIS